MKNHFFLLLFVLFLFSLSAQNADITILKQINLNRNRSADPTFRAVTNSASPVCIGIPVILFTHALFTKDTIEKKNALYAGASLTMAAIISTGLKYGIQRPRPFIKYPFIEKASSAGSPSFPSGHTSSSFALATSLSLAYHKWYIIAPAFIWASSVAYSRMDLGVHYPSDVLAGALIGSGSSFLCYKLNKLFTKTIIDKNMGLTKLNSTFLF